MYADIVGKNIGKACQLALIADSEIVNGYRPTNHNQRLLILANT